MQNETKSSIKDVTIYTDGSSLGNPGPGGYGVILVYQGHRKELSGGFRFTTNNRMEIMGAIVGLASLKNKCDVTIYTDSKLLVDSIMKGWAKRWQMNGWKRDKKHKALNSDLWQKLLDLCNYHDVKFNWIKAHVGHPENEHCDKLAKKAAGQSDLPLDKMYEKTQNSSQLSL